MRRTRLLIAAAIPLFALPPTALAHAELVSSRPPAGSVLDTGPDEVVVTFDSELDPDASSLQVLAADGTVIGEGGVDLDVANRNELRAPVSISRDGRYSVVWTAASVDGHVESGEFGFQVGTAPTNEVADTALRAPLPKFGLIGAFLLALSAAIGVLRRRPTSR